MFISLPEEYLVQVVYDNNIIDNEKRNIDGRILIREEEGINIFKLLDDEYVSKFSSST